MDLADIATELYALPPEEFTAARDEQAKAARARGDRTLAREIGSLRRPTRSAWVVNQLSRRDAAGVAELVQLGEALREAQRALDREAMRRHSSDRRDLVGRLLATAGEIAADAGHPLTDAVGREVESTLEAAVADETAGKEVRAGRLTGALTYAGFGTVPDSSRTGRAAGKPAVTGTRRRAEKVATDELAGRCTTRAVAQATEEARVAEEAAAADAEAVDAAAGRREEAAARVADLEAALEAARADQRAASAALREARKAAERSQRRARAARRKADQAG